MIGEIRFTASVLLCIALTACNMAPVIKQFRIDKTSMKELELMNYKYRELTEENDIEKKNDELSTLPISDFYTLCPGVREIRVGDFSKNDINYSTISLTFYHDTLIHFECLVSYGLQDVLTTKYPNYTRIQADKQTIFKWYNHSTVATLFDDDKFNAITFTIEDEPASSSIYKLAARKRNEYLKNANRNL
jgi:hypothetical protein